MERNLLASPPKQEVTCIWWFLVQLLVLTPCIFLGPLKGMRNKEYCRSVRGDWSVAVNGRCERHFCAPVIAPPLVSDFNVPTAVDISCAHDSIPLLAPDSAPRITPKPQRLVQPSVWVACNHRGADISG